MSPRSGLFLSSVSRIFLRASGSLAIGLVAGRALMLAGAIASARKGASGRAWLSGGRESWASGTNTSRDRVRRPPHIVLHNGIAVLDPKAFEDPLRRMSLLGRSGSVALRYRVREPWRRVTLGRR